MVCLMLHMFGYFCLLDYSIFISIYTSFSVTNIIFASSKIMQTILKVYKGDSESSPLLLIHTPWAPAVRVIMVPYGTFVIIRKSSPYRKMQSHVRTTTGQEANWWKDFFLHVLPQPGVLLLCITSKMAWSSPARKNHHRLFTFFLCVWEHYSHGVIRHVLECLTHTWMTFFHFVFTLNTTTWIAQCLLSSLWLYGSNTSILTWPSPCLIDIYVDFSVCKILLQWLFLYTYLCSIVLLSLWTRYIKAK